MGKTESFEFLNELALAFRRGEKNARPQHAPILEGIRAVLAHLNASGRLIPAGGMALTAEQVEDVRKAREALRGYRNFEGSIARGHVNRLIAAVDALFPATEPAEDGWGDVNPDDPQGRTYRETAEEYYSAPAEPAEKETKAEHNASVARREALGRVAQQLYEQSFDGCDGTFYHDFGRALEDFLPSQGWTRTPASSPVAEETKAERRDPDALAKRMAWIWHDGWDTCGERERDYLRRAAEMAHSYYFSSPVVPAPTETGPWHHRDGRICVYVQHLPLTLRYRIGRFNLHGDFVHDDSKRQLPEGFAPFVAAEEAK